MIEQTKLVLKIFIYGKKTQFTTTIYVLQRPYTAKRYEKLNLKCNFSFGASVLYMYTVFRKTLRYITQK